MPTPLDVSTAITILPRAPKIPTRLKKEQFRTLRPYCRSLWALDAGNAEVKVAFLTFLAQKVLR